MDRFAESFPVSSYPLSSPSSTPTTSSSSFDDFIPYGSFLDGYGSMDAFMDNSTTQSCRLDSVSELLLDPSFSLRLSDSSDSTPNHISPPFTPSLINVH